MRWLRTQDEDYLDRRDRRTKRWGACTCRLTRRTKAWIGRDTARSRSDTGLRNPGSTVWWDSVGQWWGRSRAQGRHGHVGKPARCYSARCNMAMKDS